MERVLRVILLSDRTSYYTFCELRYSLEFQLTQDGHINPFKNKEEIKNFCDQFCQKMIDGIQEGKVLSSFLVYLPIITSKKKMVVVFVLQKLPARVSLITLVIKKLDWRENVYFSLQFAYIK